MRRSGASASRGTRGCPYYCPCYCTCEQLVCITLLWLYYRVATQLDLGHHTHQVLPHQAYLRELLLYGYGWFSALGTLNLILWQQRLARFFQAGALTISFAPLLSALLLFARLTKRQIAQRIRDLCRHFFNTLPAALCRAVVFPSFVFKSALPNRQPDCTEKRPCYETSFVPPSSHSPTDRDPYFHAVDSTAAGIAFDVSCAPSCRRGGCTKNRRR